jgi:hypothetical protein
MRETKSMGEPMMDSQVDQREKQKVEKRVSFAHNAVTVLGYFQ